MVVKSYSTKRKEVGDPKTKVSREIPVHPILAEVLSGWRSQGWRELMGREPESSDLIVPSRRGVCRSANHMLKKFHQDLKRIGCESEDSTTSVEHSSRCVEAMAAKPTRCASSPTG